MPAIAVAVQSDLSETTAPTPGPDWLSGVVRCGLAQVLPPNAVGQVSLLLTDDATVQGLNRQYRGLDETTDVLSFSAEYAGHWEGAGSSSCLAGKGCDEADSCFDFPIPADEPSPLGDIVISVPQALRQAGAQGIPLRRELALLLIHGALHLLGYDHYGDAERAVMQGLEQAALAAIFGDTEGTNADVATGV